MDVFGVDGNDGGDDEDSGIDTFDDDTDDEIVDVAVAEAEEKEEQHFHRNIIPEMIIEKAPAKLTRNLADPTSEEGARHDATHLQFRPWCPICVEARSTEDPHYRQTVDEREQGHARVCVDSCENGENPNDKAIKQHMIVARDKKIVGRAR